MRVIYKVTPETLAMRFHASSKATTDRGALRSFVTRGIQAHNRSDNPVRHRIAGVKCVSTKPVDAKLIRTPGCLRKFQSLKALWKINRELY
jgi:hypothetical protein